jgi:AbrB family looped-hinge helix DNA binding protein
MREYVTVITRKGQITLPADVRRTMGLVQGDRVAVKVDDDGQVSISPAESWTARTAGIFNSYATGPPLTAEELRTAAEVAIAESVIERSR